MTDLVTTHRGYQKPRPGQKLKEDVLRLIAALDAIDVDVADLLLALSDKSDVGHGHSMGAISGLVAALGNKLDVGYHDALANLTDVDVAGVANGMALLRQASKWIPVALQINNIAGLEAALNGKATPADITAAINGIVGAAPGALDTLIELATALGNDPNFATTMTNALAKRVKVDGAQTFTGAERGQARGNIGADLLGGSRNYLINPDMYYWQRASSQTLSGWGSVDRWQANHAVDTKTVSLQAFAEGQTAVPGNPRFFARTQVVSAANAATLCQLAQPIEDVRRLAGKEVTVTFWAKADAPKNLAIELSQVMGTGGSPSAGTRGIGAQKIALTTAWQKFTRVINIPSLAGKVVGTAGDDCTYLIFWFEAGSNHAAYTDGLGLQSGTFDIAHVSLVEGDATKEDDPFSPRHPGEELALCCRYYESGYYHFVGYAAAGSGYGNLQTFAAPKRRLPTMSNTVSNAINVNTPTLSGGTSRVGFTHNGSAVASATTVHTGAYFADAEF